MKNLGLPEHFGRRKRDLFASIVERIKQKASGWSNRYLSSAGKLVMLQSVLTPIPSHSMSCFKLPVSLCQRIQSALTRFYWDDRTGKRKMAWISWPKLTLPKIKGGLGVRDIQAFNDAYLAKISCRLMDKPEGLLGRTLLSKYCPEGNLLSCEAPSAASHGWHSILAGRDLLVQNLGWVIGDGSSISLWNDQWLSLTTPQRPMGPPPLASLKLVVKDLLLPNSGDWDRTSIQAILPCYAEQILSLQPSTKGAPDVQRWLGTKSGKYSVKSGYHVAMEELTEEILEGEATMEFDWKKTVWNLKLPPKVKMFTWKSLKGILPVGERLLHRHINVDPKCKRCGGSESINHLLFHCPFARELWKLFPLDGSFEVSGLTDLRADWMILHSQKCLPPPGIIATLLVPWILWALWKARNKFVFENYAGNPADTLSQAIAAAREWENAQEKEEKRAQLPSQSCEREFEIVANSDAAWSESSRNAGLGWIVKHREQSIREQSTRGQRGISFIASVLIAEGLALRDVVIACRDQGMKRVRFESDSVQLIQAINSKEPPPELYGIVEDILLLARSFDDSVFLWISRLRNVVADLLAKKALSLYEQQVVVDGLNPPPN